MDDYPVPGEPQAKDEAESVEEPKKLDLTTVARQVLAGEWGLGVDRRQALKNAGYDPNEVKREIVRLMNERP